jgi:hypothetical protein
LSTTTERETLDVCSSADIDEILARGMGALARASEESWVVAHFGAALISGAFLLKGNSLPSDSAERLLQRLKKTIHHDPVRYALPKPSRRCSPAAILEALDTTIATPRNSGHGTIYAVHALRVLHELPALQTETLVNAVARLTFIAQADDAGRYYGTADHMSELNRAVPLVCNTETRIEETISELRVTYDDQSIDGKRYFFSGEKIHLVTHLHALLWLEELGSRALANKGTIAQRHFIRFARQVPPGENKPLVPGRVDPTDPNYWNPVRDPWHDIKFAHAISELTPRLSAMQHTQLEPALAGGWAAFA